MTQIPPPESTKPEPPAIRRPVLFYACVLVAFGLLAAAAIRLASL